LTTALDNDAKDRRMADAKTSALDGDFDSREVKRKTMALPDILESLIANTAAGFGVGRDRRADFYVHAASFVNWVVIKRQAIPLPLLKNVNTVSSLFRAVPAVGRNVEHDAIRIAELVLGIFRHMRGRAQMTLAAVHFNRLLHRIDVVDPDAEMV